MGKGGKLQTGNGFIKVAREDNGNDSTYDIRLNMVFTKIFLLNQTLQQTIGFLQVDEYMSLKPNRSENCVEDLECDVSLMRSRKRFGIAWNNKSLDIIIRNIGFGINGRMDSGCPFVGYGIFLLMVVDRSLAVSGIRFDDSLTLSHLFYADDAVFIGKWDRANILTIVRMLKCFFLASGLQINILKSKLMGIGVSNEEVLTAANIIGCSTFSTPFSYLGVKVRMSPSRRKA
ncbi:hypothetical protein Tco_0490930 [Tanacetum coccineum]